jgi:hypothetical protein
MCETKLTDIRLREMLAQKESLIPVYREDGMDIDVDRCEQEASILRELLAARRRIRLAVAAIEQMVPSSAERDEVLERLTEDQEAPDGE